LVRVPSAIVPAGANFLLNPAHADAARISIASSERAAFDARLMAFVRAYANSESMSSCDA
jgi:hypothetical protein